MDNALVFMGAGRLMRSTLADAEVPPRLLPDQTDPPQ